MGQIAKSTTVRTQALNEEAAMDYVKNLAQFYQGLPPSEHGLTSSIGTSVIN